MTTLIILFCSLILCFLFSAFFSGSEMAYSSVNTLRLQNLSEEKNNTSARRALYITEHFDHALSTILIGNNLVNIASSSIISVISFLLFKTDTYTWILTAVDTVIIVIFCETLPKILGKKNATSLSMKYSLFLRVLMFVLTPIVNIVVWLVKLLTLPFKEKDTEDEDENTDESVEELQSIIETAEDEGVIDEDDSEIVQNAIDFADISASEVMTARIDVQAIDIESKWSDILEMIDATPYSRIPVYQDSTDNIIGILHLNSFFSMFAQNKGEKFDIAPLLLKPCYVYKTMKLPSVLMVFRKEKQHMAIVTDEYSGTLGIITLEDVLEQIVGDIWDETDTIENDVVVKNDEEFEVDGDIPINEFIELAGISEDEFDAESETAGGWAVEMLNHFPETGESFEYRNLTVKVIAMDGRRVDRLLITKNLTNADS